MVALFVGFSPLVGVVSAVVSWRCLPLRLSPLRHSSNVRDVARDVKLWEKSPL